MSPIFCYRLLGYHCWLSYPILNLKRKTRLDVTVLTNDFHSVFNGVECIMLIQNSLYISDAARFLNVLNDCLVSNVEI